MITSLSSSHVVCHQDVAMLIRGLAQNPLITGYSLLLSGQYLTFSALSLSLWPCLVFDVNGQYLTFSALSLSLWPCLVFDVSRISDSPPLICHLLLVNGCNCHLFTPGGFNRDVTPSGRDSIRTQLHRDVTPSGRDSIGLRLQIKGFSFSSKLLFCLFLFS